MTFPYILLFFVTQQTDGSQCFLIFEHVLSRVSNVIDIMTITFFSKSVFHWQLFITYIFSVSLKFQACYITGQWGEFTVKNATLHVLILFWHFFLFLIKKLCFFRFHFFFFDEVSNFRHRILTNQKPKHVIRSCHCNCIQKTRWSAFVWKACFDENKKILSPSDF